MERARQLFVVLIFIVAISGCMHVPERPYCKNHIANATLSYFRGIEEDNSTYIFSKINGYDKLKYLDRMYADAEGISEGDPAYLELKAKLRQKLMQGNADMFYACDDDSEVFLCVTYDVDERLSREYEPETVTWRWCLLYHSLMLRMILALISLWKWVSVMCLDGILNICRTKKSRVVNTSVTVQ